jgi:hypothetical protein
LNLITTYYLWILIVLLVSNHPFKHLRWMQLIVPVQLQGDIKGLNNPFSSTSSDPQQIRQVGAPALETEWIEFYKIRAVWGLLSPGE